MSFTGLGFVEILVDGKWVAASESCPIFGLKEVYYQKRGRIVPNMDATDLEYKAFHRFGKPGPNGEVDLMPSTEILHMLKTDEQEYLSTGGKSLWNGNGFLKHDVASFDGVIDKLELEIQQFSGCSATQDEIRFEMETPQFIKERIIEQVENYEKKIGRTFDLYNEVRIIEVAYPH